MEYVLRGSTANTRDLIVGFLNTLPLRSKDLLESAIEDFTKIDQDELLDILQEFDCRLMVHEQNIKAVLSEIAHKEVIQRSKYIIDILRLAHTIALIAARRLTSIAALGYLSNY